ncbi:MAG: hypothetical protein IJV14_10965, partial [Lachnospiraceae bacterium]|nr:hypothetical protein [Lachnospiraceae bacterium]
MGNGPAALVFSFSFPDPETGILSPWLPPRPFQGIKNAPKGGRHHCQTIAFEAWLYFTRIEIMAGILKFPYFHSCVFFSSEGLQRGVMEGIIREDDGAIAAGLSENIKKPP